MPITARRLQKEIGIECRLTKKTSKKRSGSKMQNSFVLTPRRRTAMLANLEKARTAPNDRVYQSTKKRRDANLANLQ
jgi:hypothetical protein